MMEGTWAWTGARHPQGVRRAYLSTFEHRVIGTSTLLVQSGQTLQQVIIIYFDVLFDHVEESDTISAIRDRMGRIDRKRGHPLATEVVDVPRLYWCPRI